MKGATIKPDNSQDLNPRNDFQQIDTKSDVYKQIFKYSVIPTVVHDKNAIIIDANDSAIEEFGFSRNELLKKHVFDLHTDEEIENCTSILCKLHDDTKTDIESKFKRKDGSVFIARATPCKYIIGGKPVTHVYIQDITENKKTEQTLHDLNTALEAEVEKVENHAHELKLRNKELAEFAFVAAHDLKAPVTNLMSLVDMVDFDKIADDQNSEIFLRLKNSIELIHKTVYTLNDVINFKTTLKDRAQHLSFDKTLSEIKESIASKLEESEANINVDFTQYPEINYPPIHLKSIMQNLVTNAVKYKNPDKPLIIEIKSTNHNGSACLQIKDNGLGFDAEKYGAKVFGLFTRLHTHVDGKGVGLHIVKSILDSHGGRIEVKSKPFEGAEFSVYLNNAKYE